jgi:cytoskeletal protein CcmA (bactofilin family)
VVFLLLGLFALALPSPAGAGLPPGTAFRAGGEIRVEDGVDGDLWAAGGSLSVGGLVAGNVTAATGDCTTSGNITGSLRLAAGTTTVQGRVGRNLTFAGGRLNLTGGSLVEGDLTAGVGELLVGGEVEGALRAAARRVVVSGTVQGPALVTAAKLEILPGARLEGGLTFRGPGEPLIHPGAFVARNAAPPVWLEGFPRRMIRILAVALSLLVVGPLFLGALLLLVAPGYCQVTVQNLLAHPLPSIGLGMAFLLATPVVALLLVVTLVGAPLGLILLAAYPLALLTGLLLGLFATGEGILRLAGRPGGTTRGRLVADFALGLSTVALAGITPLAGPLLTVVVAAGLGAVVLGLHLRRKAPDIKPDEPPRRPAPLAPSPWWTR